MKKKVAFLANGWTCENLGYLLTGLIDNLPKDSVDIFTFIANNFYLMPDFAMKSETSIYSFPHWSDYACAIVFTSGFNSSTALDAVYKELENVNIPVICIGDNHPGFYNLLVDNIHGMKELLNHLYTKHNVRSFEFIAGANDNMDSNIRLDVVKDFAKEHDIPFTEDDIFYSNWEAGLTVQHIMSKYKAKTNIPDAFICANDLVGVGVTIGFENLGLSIPEDAKMTGFDYLQGFRYFYPSFATVDQSFDALGKACAELLLKIFNGEEIPETTYVPSRFIPGESCGCFESRNETEARKKYVRNEINTRSLETAFSGRLIQLEYGFLESVTMETVADTVGKVFYEGDGSEGRTFHLLLDPDFANLTTTEIKDMPQYSYNEKMMVVVSKDDGKPTNVKYCNSRDVIPAYSGEGSNKIYYIMPLYIDTYVCGYTVNEGNLDILGKRFFPDFNSHISKLLISFKTNIQLTSTNKKLAELMQTDALTKLKNRTAFENAKEKLRQEHLMGKTSPFAIIMFDINNLKTINDYYGHADGDLYIKSCCKLICQSFKHSPIYRIGGDEFIAIVSNDDYPIREELLEDFRNKMEDFRTQQLSPYDKPSIASGMADYSEIGSEHFNLLFSMADDRMYENKRMMKARAL